MEVQPIIPIIKLRYSLGNWGERAEWSWLERKLETFSKGVTLILELVPLIMDHENQVNSAP